MGALYLSEDSSVGEFRAESAVRRQERLEVGTGAMALKTVFLPLVPPFSLYLFLVPLG